MQKGAAADAAAAAADDNNDKDGWLKNVSPPNNLLSSLAVINEREETSLSRS